MTFVPDHRPTANAVLTDKEIDRLPPMFREIVEHQRELERFCSDASYDQGEVRR